MCAKSSRVELWSRVSVGLGRARTTLLDTLRRCVADAFVHVLDGVFDGGTGIFFCERGCGKARGDWGEARGSGGDGAEEGHCILFWIAGGCGCGAVDINAVVGVWRDGVLAAGFLG